MIVRIAQATPPAAPPAATGVRPGLWLLLAAITVTGPLTLNIYLPALPFVQEMFGTTTAATQSTVSAALLAFALAAFAGGPLSDRYGRRPLILTGLALQIAGSLLCWSADGIPLLIAGRVVQSLGTGITTTVVRAVLGDLYPRDRMVSALAYFTLLTMLGPFLAPLAGTWLMHAGGLPSLFVTLIGVAAVLFVLAARSIGESRRAVAGVPGARELRAATVVLLRDRAFVASVLQVGTWYGVYLSFAAVMPYVMVADFGRGPDEFALHFLIVGVGYGVGNLLVTRLITRHGGARLLRAGQWLAFAGALGGVVVALLHPGAPWPLFVATAVMVAGHGLAVPNLVAAAISHTPAIAGTALSLLFTGQQILGALYVQASGQFPTDTALPVMLLGAVSSAAMLTLGARRTTPEETTA
jgi:DHA1 family bicyclomycin/chloramphenicol resistance-like MFS transporter